MKHSHIPQPIAEAAVTMLRPYVPELTVDKLEKRITGNQDKRPEKLLTRKEAAKLLSVSIPTIDRMLRDGELNRQHIRGAVRISRSAVERLMKESPK